MPNTFEKHGWIRSGFAGYQPDMAEIYISTGSLYLCAAAFISLGLDENNPFWSASATDWSGKKGWSGIDIGLDKALKK